MTAISKIGHKIDASHELSMSMFSPHKTNLAPYKSI